MGVITAQFIVVSDYVNYARVLLQDTVAPQRYADNDLVAAFNLAIIESRRLRPDMWIGVTSLPAYSGSDSTVVDTHIDPQYQVAFVYYIVGMAQLRDEEPTQDQRAGIFLSRFTQMLLSLT